MPTERGFEPGDRVENIKTGETGTVMPDGPMLVDAVAVQYDSDEFGQTWWTPPSKLRHIPDPTS